MSRFSFLRKYQNCFIFVVLLVLCCFAWMHARQPRAQSDHPCSKHMHTLFSMRHLEPQTFMDAHPQRKNTLCKYNDDWDC